MRVRQHGRGPTLLAIHGLGGSGRYWNGLAERVGDRFTVVAPDLAGFGASHQPDVPTDRALHLATLDAVTQDRGPTVVVGHSLGGVLGLLWTARRAGRVRGLSMNAAPYPTPKPAWDPANFRGPRGIIARGLAGAAHVAWPVVSLPAQAFSRYPAGVVRDYGRQSIRGRAWTLWSLWTDPALGEVVRQAARSHPGDLPILLEHAADDRSVPVSSMDAYAKLLPGAAHRVLPDGGHQFLLARDFRPIVSWLDATVAADPRARRSDGRSASDGPPTLGP